MLYLFLTAGTAILVLMVNENRRKNKRIEKLEYELKRTMTLVEEAKTQGFRI